MSSPGMLHDEACVRLTSGECANCWNVTRKVKKAHNSPDETLRNDCDQSGAQSSQSTDDKKQTISIFDCDRNQYSLNHDRFSAIVSDLMVFEWESGHGFE